MITIDKRSERNLIRILRAKSKQMSSKKLQTKVLKKSTKPVLDIAKDLVAVKTGKLKKSIRAEEYGDGISVLTDVIYAASEEYLGTPYMRPAAQRGFDKSVRIAASEYKKEAVKKI